MIYAIPYNLLPKEELCIEKIEYRDEDSQTWELYRTENSFFLTYTGDKIMFEKCFVCNPSPKTVVKINNTNCIMFKVSDFDAFCDIRTILTKGSTEEIWFSLTSLFEDRLREDKSILESEYYH